MNLIEVKIGAEIRDPERGVGYVVELLDKDGNETDDEDAAVGGIIEWEDTGTFSPFWVEETKH